ncbi:MAG: hypothetical protein K9K84_11085 [Methylovulum sp.]|nr:hypothetical protein [Methylovulum sp.]
MRAVRRFASAKPPYRFKDDFLDIKNETEQQIITAHGVPPILLGIIPENTGGLGNPVLGKAVVGFGEPNWKLLGG